jgi:hypothetical protein
MAANDTEAAGLVWNPWAFIGFLMEFLETVAARLETFR